MTEEEVRQESQAILQRIAERLQPIANTIIQLELEQRILDIRLKVAKRQLAPEWGKCPTCKGNQPFKSLLPGADGLSRTIGIPCATCGSGSLSWWEEQLGINAA